MHKLIAIVIAFAACVCRAQPPWTDLTPPPGARVLYVSASGSGTACSVAQPCSLSQGLSLLRNGQPDQVLLKRGDTFVLGDQITLTKSANSTKAYMVIGAYGKGGRPKIRTPSHGIFGGNSSGQHNGLAIVGLDLAPIAMTPTSDGIVLLSTTGNSWDDVLIEDCLITGYSAGIVAQVLVDGQVFERIKIRQCVIADNDNNGGGHAQGIFLGGAANWLIENCVLDNNARSKADMFCHNLYVHQWGGPGIFRNNVSSRACSHGGQQRPGGLAENNLFLQNPINFYIGLNSLVYGDQVNRFRLNVALDSRNINSTDIRGIGYVLSGAPGTLIESNIAAHQLSGTGNVQAFDFDGLTGAIVIGNLVRDWTYNGMWWGQAFTVEPQSSVAQFRNNRAYMTTGGVCLTNAGGGWGSFSGNRYWTSTSPMFAGGSDASGLIENPGPQDGSIAAYLNFHGIPPGPDPVAVFATLARANSRLSWDDRWTAPSVNSWVRGVFDVVPTCYADFDGNGALNVNDFVVFGNAYAANDLSANCDGSTASPILNVNDFQCFLNKFAAGCP